MSRLRTVLSGNLLSGVGHGRGEHAAQLRQRQSRQQSAPNDPLEFARELVAVLLQFCRDVGRTRWRQHKRPFAMPHLDQPLGSQPFVHTNDRVHVDYQLPGELPDRRQALTRLQQTCQTLRTDLICDLP
jgi:hypothetical protein